MNIKLIIKGIIIGIAKIIPGLSGTILMISFNLYDKAISSVTNFFNDIKENTKFLLNLGVGVGIGIIFFSKIVNYFINNYYLYTTSLFIGLILGGIPTISKNIKHKKTNNILIITAASLMILLSITTTSNTYIIKNNYTDIIMFFIAGILEAIGTIIPGISSTALLMLIGIYNIYIKTISNILSIKYIINTIRFILPFTFGLFISIIFLSLLINYLFKNYKEKTFAFILGISISTIILLIYRIIPLVNSIKDLIICIILTLIGSKAIKTI